MQPSPGRASVPVAPIQSPGCSVLSPVALTLRWLPCTEAGESSPPPPGKHTAPHEPTVPNFSGSYDSSGGRNPIGPLGTGFDGCLFQNPGMPCAPGAGAATSGEFLQTQAGQWGHSHWLSPQTQGPVAFAFPATSAFPPCHHCSRPQRGQAPVSSMPKATQGPDPKFTASPG